MHRSPVPSEPPHGHGLADDLGVACGLLRRRRALTWLAAWPGSAPSSASGGGAAATSAPAAVAGLAERTP